MVATSLYLVEKTGWRNAVCKGFPLALVASMVVAFVLGSLFLIGSMVVSRVIH